MELCLLNLLILIDCFLCNSCHCVLFESLSHVINQKSYVYSRNLGKIYLVHFLKFWNLPGLAREISKFQKVNSVNLSQIFFLNMWLLILISIKREQLVLVSSFINLIRKVYCYSKTLVETILTFFTIIVWLSLLFFYQVV